MAVLSKSQMSEEDVKFHYITPAITAKWNNQHITLETKITDGRINLKGNIVAREKSKRADYVLYLSANNPIAIVEAKDNNHTVSHGLQQAMTYAQMLDVPFAFSSNGDGFAEHDFLTGKERTFGLDEFPTEKELVERYKAGANDGAGLTDVQEKLIAQPYYSSQNTYPPRYYQRIAINRTLDAIARGQNRLLLVMATGTGKTLTGLGALTTLSQAVDNKLAVIIVCPYQHLVEQWVEDIVKFNIQPIIGYSSSSQKDWKKRLENAVRDQKLKVRNKEFFCFICTNATYTSEFVQKQIFKIKSDILLMVDEAHNFGAPYLSCLLHEFYTYRLALSATIDRHNDEEGTEKLFSFFGDKCIEYSLDRAIKEKKLTPYKYYPVIITFTDEELETYNNLTYEMGKCIIKGQNGKNKLSPRGEKLALQRSRIVAGAKGKLAALEETIQPYLHDKHILVYCGATRVRNFESDDVSLD